MLPIGPTILSSENTFLPRDKARVGIKEAGGSERVPFAGILSNPSLTAIRGFENTIPIFINRFTDSITRRWIWEIDVIKCGFMASILVDSCPSRTAV